MRIAILIPCYNRPDYLKQVLADVLAIPQVQLGLPVILACDGGENAALKENLAVAADSRIPQLHCIARAEHMGIGRNVHQAKRYVFEECQFDQVLYIEDDIRVSPQILTHLLNVQGWLQANYSNACLVSTASSCTMSREEKEANLAWVLDCGGMLNNHLQTRDCWNMMRPWMQEYVRQFLQCAYRDRDNEAIRAWMKKLAQRLPVQQGDRMFPVRWPVKEHFLGEPATSQDAATALSLRLAGFSHVVSIVNRAWHVGKQGENSTDAAWEQTYGSTTLDVFESDNARTYFRLKP